jgi:hypothetical protein
MSDAMAQAFEGDAGKYIGEQCKHPGAFSKHFGLAIRKIAFALFQPTFRTGWSQVP